MQVDERHGLRRMPHGNDLQDPTESEKWWVKAEQEVREWALAHPERWQSMPLGSGDDNEAFERCVYLQTAKRRKGER
eukprot:14104213-Alexandrium_andersonii.AAC.1